MMEYRSGQSANHVHTALKSALQTMEKAQQCAVLWFGEILERRLYRELGYSSINQYAKLELGFSSSRTGDFLQLCRKLKKLPKVKAKVASGELGYTAARVLVPVVDETNEKGWLDFALNNSRRVLEQEVKRARREAADEAVGQPALIPVSRQRPAAVVPVRVSLEMSPTQFARYEKLWEQIRGDGSAPADKVEALLEIMACYTAQCSPRGDVRGSAKPTRGNDQGGAKPSRGDAPTAVKPPVQIHIHQCPDCAKPTVQTSKGELEIGKSEWERAQCDCQVSRPGGRNKTSIPPAVRKRVLARYRHQCQRPGCNHTQFLHIHHKIPRSQGGSNDPKNLICLCSACHQLIHEQKSASFVKSPREVYQWQSQSMSPQETYQWQSQSTSPQETYCRRFRSTTPPESNNGDSDNDHTKFQDWWPRPSTQEVYRWRSGATNTAPDQPKDFSISKAVASSIAPPRARNFSTKNRRSFSGSFWENLTLPVQEAHATRNTPTCSKALAY